MKKFTIVLVLSFVSLLINAQSYNNEWIDYSKTYYKFKVGRTGLYRITSSTLSAVGLGNENVQNIQIWRNGKQVTLFTSATSGPIGNGYIEFWGEHNDGVADKDLYRSPALQLSDKVSLQTDTAAFFLTVNSLGNNLRFSNTANNVSGNTIPAEPYFIHSLRHNFRDRIHRGYALLAGHEYLYSSSYDHGEMFSSWDITPSSPAQVDYGGLAVATSGPSAKFRISMAGSAPNGWSLNDRTYKAEINGTSVIDTILNQFDARINHNNNVPLSVLSSNSAVVRISNRSTITTDRIVSGFFELTYPRQFSFANLPNFAFSIPASATGKYLEISNFNAGGSTPVLYDLTNNRRYVTEFANGVVRVVLQPSASEANLVLVSQADANIIPVTNLVTRNFVNYNLAANRADYVIISHPSLQTPYSGADQVDQYRAYRASATGGGFNAKIFDIDQLVDQFAFGIKKHPLSIRNFLRLIRTGDGLKPKYVFLVGKGVSYDEYRYNQGSAMAERLNIIPTWGYPASDILLTSDNLQPVMSTPIGRISVVSPQELAEYLDKVKQYEQAQQNNNQTIDNKAWMKNVVHVAGGNDPSLDLRLAGYFRAYERTIEDTLFGGNVVSFNKTTTGAVTPIVSSLLEQTFQKGISLLTYFGHSSASSLDYNLNDPYSYNNAGKYPIFLVNGCNAGNLYSFDTSRLSVLASLSEIWVLAKNRGSIGFIASTHFGLENYLHFYTDSLYRSISVKGYGKGIGNNISDATIDLIKQVGPTDFFGRIHAEETTLHGDPAIKVNSFPKADFAIEEPQIKINPAIVSADDANFTVKAYIHNIGKATGDSVQIQVRRQFPGGGIETIYNRKIKSVRYLDSIVLVIPINATNDQGENRITVSIDDINSYDELSEMNNTATKSFIIFADVLKPIYPYNYSIVNKTPIKLAASTANPIIGSREYTMEIDTTEMFNSPLKAVKTLTSNGGLLEFDPGITFTDSTVYYWRVKPSASTSQRWNTASFIYISGSSSGYNQSHLYQHLKSNSERMFIDSFDRRWKYATNLTNLTIINSIFPTSGTEDNQFSIGINGTINISSACVGHSVIFNVFDPVSMKPYFNNTFQPSTTRADSLGKFMNSGPMCNTGREYNFEFSYMDSTGRRRMRDFMDWIPSGAYVTARLIFDQPFDQNPFINEWKSDEQVYGAGNSFYGRIKTAGFAAIDSFTRPRTWAFVYKKNDASFEPKWKFSEGLSDRITLNAVLPSTDTLGFITSPSFGPAKAWKQVKWRGSKLETTSGDDPVVSVIGVTANGNEQVLYMLNANQQDFDISSVSTTQYPFLKLKMRNPDSLTLTPYQLRYWRILYDPVPEGALAPSIAYKAKDTLELGEKLDFSIAFKNVSDVAFADSLKVKLVVYNKSNVATVIPITDKKRLAAGDTITVSTSIDTKDFEGNNTIYLDVNPEPSQPEQTRSNNFLYKNMFVKADNYNPLMDVTFDGVHILNGDIVSAKPNILIKLKDEAKFLALDDTSLATVYVRYPDPNGGANGVLRRFAFGTDTLRFIPADVSSGRNEAMVEFNPHFMEDSNGDFYELIVRGKDKSGNAAGPTEYKVRFQVYNKPMISNMFNYPNPFTTSTAFVFTITGSDIPQNLRIQILTVTGKIVRDITKDELGPLRIGRNITEFKWDGTDQYGQKLGNGIYLYRVITNLNGNSLEKFNTIDASGDKVNTDKYFNKGYGKMYLMR